MVTASLHSRTKHGIALCSENVLFLRTSELECCSQHLQSGHSPFCGVAWQEIAATLPAGKASLTPRCPEDAGQQEERGRALGQ